MTLSAGTRLGPYEIESPIGAGGMGEVYRAHDSRLDRTVAIKVLPEHIAADPQVRERFEREAKTLAALSHPHICPVFDVGRQDGIDFLVMEHLEGETLADRLARAAGSKDPALRIEEVLRFAIQIADALDKAHRKGIVHRDLKPGNIMLTKGGAKLLDFGLAKMQPPTGAVAGMSIAATVSRPLTGQGTILGTLHYMAPEQVEGREADTRSDLFAFGAVVYEMATGKKAFEGKSAASIMAAILEREPPVLSTLQPLTPRALDHIVSQCLAKDPDERWQTAGDVMRELKWITDAGAQASVPTSGAARPAKRERLAWAAGLAVVAAVAVVLGVSAFRSAPVAREMRVQIATPLTTDPATLAISPDGQKIVFAATSDGSPRLWLRSLDSTAARPLPGTDRGRIPFWSADSRSIGFFADGTFKRLDIDTGSERDLLNAVTSSGGAWNHDNVILLSMGNVQPIRRVPADGGEPMPVTKNVAGSSHRTPHFLPDGRHFLYWATGSPETRGVYVAALDDSQSRRLLDVESPAAYASGHLFYLLQDTLVARPFDPIAQTFTGEPVRIAEGVAGFSVAADGSIIYRTGTNTGLGATGVRQLVWFDRSGTSLGTLADPQIAASPALSPDGSRVALHRAIAGQNTDVWLLETSRGGRVRFTSNADGDAFPVWSPDGKSIAFQSYQKGRPGDIYRKSATGAGPEEPLLSTADVTHPMDWSPDGRFVLYRSQLQGSNSSQWNLWAAPVGGKGEPFPVVQTNFDERDGQFSPDGKWIAFESNETGRYEIYVQPFPGPGAKVSISAGGGAQVRWRHDGRELFYIALDGQLMAVPIQLSGAGQPDIGAAVPLFRTNVGGAIAQGVTRQQYDVSTDGQRFLMNTLVEEANASPITLILNWKPKP
jgi:Tol biopolymer transport system component